jgi:TetR/AcrR family transcriptional regulator
VFARTGFEGATMAGIAKEAGLPKANLHYYFGNKRDLYRAVLDAVLHDWLAPLDAITPEADPAQAQALGSYIHLKMALSAERPDASRVFANELLHGAPVVGETLHTELRAMVVDKARVIDGWIAAGRMAPVDSTHLFFTIWAATQTYADFDVQMRAVLPEGRPLTTAASSAPPSTCGPWCCAAAGWRLEGALVLPASSNICSNTLAQRRLPPTATSAPPTTITATPAQVGILTSRFSSTESAMGPSWPFCVSLV